MPLIFTEYYKRFGIRRMATLPTPLLFVLDTLPREAIYHSVSYDKDVVDVDVSKPWFANYKQKIETFHVSEVNDPVGRPARMKTNPALLSVEFFKQNRKFKLLRSLDHIPRDPMNLLVVNYGYLNQLYRYPDTNMTDWYRWENIQKTLWETVHTLAQTSNRQQFIFVDLPKQPLGRTVLNIFMEKNDLSVAKMFDTHDERFVLDFWRWLNKSEKVKSTMNILGPKELKKINLVFSSATGLNCVLNLGYFYSWIKGNDNLTFEKSVYQQTPDILGKLFISMTVFLASQHPEEEYGDIERSEIKNREDKQKAEVSDPLDQELLDENESDDNSNPHETFEPPVSGLKPGLKQKEAKIDLDEFNEDNFEKRLAHLEGDLEVLNNMNLKTLKNKGLKIDSETKSITDVASLPLEEMELDPEQVRKEFFQDMDANQALLKQVDELAEISALSAREYKNLITQVQKAQEATDPYDGKKPRKEAATVKPEELQLDQKKVMMEDLPTVVDKSMLKSNLLAFDEDYLNNVIRKDILSMVDGIQKAGIVIKNHEVEMIETVMGRAESHTLELKPLEGTGSRIHFKIPIVEPDGTFLSNGSIYQMRKQRVDVPILKIDPLTVGLSSYYGKNFVAVSDKVANNSIEWLAKQVTKAGMEGDGFIIQVDPSNAFDEKFAAPYIYNAMASRFNGIKTKEVSLVFNHKTREELAGSPEVLAKLETKDRRFVGFSKQKHPIVVDQSNTFIEIKPDGENVLGNIFQVLQLDENKCPIDFTEMRVFSKTVPVAVILGYLIGIKKLFALLGVKPEVIDGKRYTIKEGEYALKFNDKILVLNKKDRLATLILSGFLQFEKQLKSYPFEEFNNKDVYFNLLESKGLGSIYIREIELSDQLFVDPITKGVLEQMGEPTTFRGLLVRASEMLLDYHKKPNRVSEELKKQGITEIDDYRQRGYERIPGAIYKELTKSIRQFKNKALSARSKIDMSPYQIWTTVMKDPSIKITEDINPVQNLKETESATFVGEGGRSKDSLNKASRAFRESDVGVVSEATVDSSDVGINVSLSADPMILNLRGIAQGAGKQLKPANVFSSAALLAPGAANDDKVCHLP